MHKTVTALTAAGLFALSFAPAYAQQTPAQPQTQTQPQTQSTAPGPPATNPNTTATTQTVQPAGQPNYGQLISALNRTRSVTAQLRGLGSLTTNNIRIVKVQSIVPPANSSQVNGAIARNQSQVAALRRTLASIPVTATTDNSRITIAQFLADNKLNVNSVVAADVANGTLLLFIQ